MCPYAAGEVIKFCFPSYDENVKQSSIQDQISSDFLDFLLDLKETLF